MTRCRVCGCTEREPCNPPCGWQPGAGNLCTNCAAIVEELAEWMEAAVHVNWAALSREAKKAAAR